MLVSSGSITIIDVNDGVNATLTQSSLIVQCDTGGSVISLNGLDTTMKVYVGGKDDSANWSFYVSNIGSGISYNDSTNTLTRVGIGVVNGSIAGTVGYIKVNSFTATDASYIEISAYKFANDVVVQRFDLVKSKAGLRGSVTAQIANQTAWSDSVANSYFSTNYKNVIISGDSVTQYGTGFAQTKVWNGSIWSLVTQIVDGNLLVNGTVTTGAIAIGAVGPNQVSPSAISTDKLLITGAGSAINNDPYTTDITAWNGSGISIVTDSTAPFGKNVLRCVDSGAAVLSGTFKISTLKNYRIKFWIRQFSGNTTAYLTAIFKDNSGNIVNGTGWPATYSYNFFGLLDQQPASVWTEYTLSFGPNETAKIDPNATNMQIGMWSNYSGGIGVQYITGIAVVEKSGSDLIVDGAVIASKLAANSIIVGTAAIQNGAIVNAMIGTAAIDDAKIANLSAGKLTAGSIAVGQTIRSTANGTDGTALWNITGDGVANFKSGTFSGSLYGANITGTNGTFSGVLSAGSVDFTTSVGTTTNYNTVGTFAITVPANMTSMRINLMGGGGGGAGGGSYSNTGGGQGGIGSVLTIITLNGLTAGTGYTLVIGAGGTAGVNYVYPFGDSTYSESYYETPTITQATAGTTSSLILTASPYTSIATSVGGGAGAVYIDATPYSGATGTHTGTSGTGTGGGVAAIYNSATAGSIGTANSGGGGGGGYGNDSSGPATSGGVGGTGRALLEFFNSTGVVLRAEMATLKGELRNQGLTIS